MYRTRKKKDYSKKGWAKQPYSGLGSRINQFVIGLMWHLDRMNARLAKHPTTSSEKAWISQERETGLDTGMGKDLGPSNIRRPFFERRIR